MEEIIEQLTAEDFPIRLYDNRGNLLYIEDENGYWEKRKYDGDNNMIQYEDSDENEVFGFFN
jgi:hypothetical protein